MAWAASAELVCRLCVGLVGLGGATCKSSGESLIILPLRSILVWIVRSVVLITVPCGKGSPPKAIVTNKLNAIPRLECVHSHFPLPASLRPLFC